MFAMKLLIVVLTAFLTLTKGEGQNTIAPSTIPANQSIGSCPAEELLEKARQNISTTIQRKLIEIYSPSSDFDCKAALESGKMTSGIYRIQPDSLDPFFVYCDMETDGGGWTVFQRRQDGSEDFYRVWDDYVSGFGNLTGEFWLGLDKIHRLTSGNATALRIDIGDFEGNTAFAQYSTFRVQDSTTEYELNVGGFSGTATDSLRYHNNQAFSTRDRDNDPDHRHCAATFRGGWWYYDCIWSCLNGPYHDGDPTPYLQPDGIVWFTWKNNYYSLRFSEMKLRRI